MNNGFDVRDKLITYFGTISGATVMSAADNTEEHISHMVVCDVKSDRQIYPATQDFEFIIGITLQSWIPDDTNGTDFERIGSEIKNKINAIVKKTVTYSSVFNDIPVVGFLYDGMNRDVTNESNIMTFSCKVYVSYDNE